MLKKNAALPTIIKINVKDFLSPVNDVCRLMKVQGERASAAALRDERDARKEPNLEVQGLKGRVIFSLPLKALTCLRVRDTQEARQPFVPIPGSPSPQQGCTELTSDSPSA